MGRPRAPKTPPLDADLPGKEKPETGDPSLNIHIATIQKNSLDSIEVAFKEYKSAVYLDIRTYSQFNGQAQKQPTKRGITLKPDQIHELREALEKAEASRR